MKTDVGRIVIMAMIVLIVVVGRLLFLCGYKSDKHMEKLSDLCGRVLVDYGIAAAVYDASNEDKAWRTQSEALAKEQAQRQEMERNQRNQMNMRRLQIWQDEFQRMKARETYESYRERGLIP